MEVVETTRDGNIGYVHLLMDATGPILLALPKNPPIVGNQACATMIMVANLGECMLRMRISVAPPLGPRVRVASAWSIVLVKVLI